MAKGDTRKAQDEAIFTPEDARLRLREAGIDADQLDDATALLRDNALRAEREQQAINDLIRKHTPRKVIGAPEPEDLTFEEKVDVLQLIGQDEFIGAHLGKDPTRLTPADRAEFERRSGHDAVIEAVLGKPLSELTSLELAQARSALRNADFEQRIAGRGQPGASEPSTPPDVQPGAEAEPPDVGADDPGSSAPGASHQGGSDDPDPPPPGGEDVTGDPDEGEVIGGSDDPGGAPPPDGGEPEGNPTDGEVTGGSDPLEGPPPDGEPAGSGSGSGAGSSSSSEPAAQPDDEEPEDSEEGGFDYFGPTNPSGESGEYHRAEDGTWTDENGDEVTDEDTVASLEHEYERYQDEVEQAEEAEDEPEADPDDDEEPDSGEGESEEEEPEETSSVEFTPAGDEGAPLPEDLQQQLRRDFADIRRLRGSTGDGVTDPADDDGFEVRDESVQLPTHAELGQSLFGQPPLDVEHGGGGGNVNPGADPHGGGVTDPTDDQVAFDGPQRDDDPFDAGPEIEPPADPPPEEDDGADVISLRPPIVADRVDDGPELPDDLVLDPPD